MENFNVETYLNSLDANVEIIDLSNKRLTSIPPLERFTSLRLLICNDNRLASLPKLPETLRMLNCNDNRLASLPKLPETMHYLYCSHNELTSFPELNEQMYEIDCSNNRLTSFPKLNKKMYSLVCKYNHLTSFPELDVNLGLEQLNCENNQLTSLPKLNKNLDILHCKDNPIAEIIDGETIEVIRDQLFILKRFHLLYYSLKFKKQFRDLLWIKVREPKIMQQFHPDNIFVEDDELEEMF